MPTFRCPGGQRTLTVAVVTQQVAVACPVCHTETIISPHAALVPVEPPPVVLPAECPADPLPMPRFIRGDVLVECPGCGRPHRVGDRECGRVEPKRQAETVRGAAGKTTQCIDCHEVVDVPESPIVVRRVSPKTGNELVSGIAAAAIIAGALTGRTISGPRQCVSCGRYLRNPGIYCYRCRPS
jgi:hypothetical protein